MQHQLAKEEHKTGQLKEKTNDMVLKGPPAASLLEQLQETIEAAKSKRQARRTGDSPTKGARRAARALESSSSSEGFAPPRRGILPEPQPAPTPAVDMEALNQQLEAKLQALKDEMLLAIDDKLQGNDDIHALKKQVEDLQKAQKDAAEQLESLTQNLSEQVAAVRVSFGQFKQESQFQLQFVEDALTQETSNYQKMKIQVRGQVNFELAKLHESREHADHEFRRLNTYMYQTQQLLNLLLEDQMIMQMLEEQDVRDREQIGLFGVKKNSEILGVNQHAMQNNIERRGGGSPRKETKTPPRPAHWGLDNKNEPYSKVVRSPEQKNTKHAEKVQQQLQAAKPLGAHDPDVLSVGNLAGLLTPTTSTADAGRSGNALSVSRHCASCLGFAPQILSHIKLACLSYTNSPVAYAPGVTLCVPDLLKVKEVLLKKLELGNANLSRFLA